MNSKSQQQCNGGGIANSNNNCINKSCSNNHNCTNSSDTFCSNKNNGNNMTGNINKNRICRDFVHGICRRKQCRYPHVMSSDLVVFCHDFQNSSCPRINCKFLHYSLQEEEYYRKFGEFPQEHNIDNVVSCQEYLMYGSCWHRDCFLAGKSSEQAFHQNSIVRVEPSPYLWNDHPGGYRSNVDRSLLSLNDYRSSCDNFQSIKRSSRGDPLDGTSFKRFRDDPDRIDIVAVIRRFEEEQIMLRRRVEANEIKIAELRASNEYLMAQNAQLRLSTVQQQCSNVVNPVTVTQTTSQPQTQQVMGGVSMAPVQVQATPIVSLATPQTQIIANSAPPIAIAANTSQGQQLAIAQQNITSLSNTTQPLAPTHAQQILGTSQITLTPAIAQGASMGLTINTSQALAMSNATQPIISYPVMTHSILPH